MICSISLQLNLSTYEINVFSKMNIDYVYDSVNDTGYLFQTLKKFQSLGLIYTETRFDRFIDFNIKLTEIGIKFYKNIFGS